MCWMKAMELKTLVSHQLFSLLPEDPRLGDKTVSMLKTTPHMAIRDSLDATLISYSQKGAQTMAYESQLPPWLSVTPATTTLNILMMET